VALPRFVSPSRAAADLGFLGLRASVFLFLVGVPFVTFFSRIVRLDAGLMLRIYAAASGLPLLASAALNIAAGRRNVPSFAGSKLCDALAWTMSAYWASMIAVGFLAGHDPNYIVSTGWNFQVPALTYLCVRRIERPAQVEALVRTIMLASAIAVPFQLISNYLAVTEQDYIGAGAVTSLVATTTVAILLQRGRMGLGLVLLAFSLLEILFSMKRAVWFGLVVFPVIFAIVGRAKLGKFLRFLGGLLAAAAVIWSVTAFLPEKLGRQRVANRIESARTDTGDFSFTSGGAREAEVRSIWAAVVDDGSVATALCGLGMGATYTYYADEVHGNEVLRGHHSTHFTPGGWFLRGGFVGLLLNGAFYAFLIATARRSAVALRDEPGAEWRTAYVTYAVIAVLVCVSSFSLTPNIATHAMLAAVPVSGGVLRRARRPA
jgi:hypothetical protein